MVIHCRLVEGRGESVESDLPGEFWLLWLVVEPVDEVVEFIFWSLSVSELIALWMG